MTSDDDFVLFLELRRRREPFSHSPPRLTVHGLKPVNIGSERERGDDEGRVDRIWHASAPRVVANLSPRASYLLHPLPRRLAAVPSLAHRSRARLRVHADARASILDRVRG